MAAIFSQMKNQCRIHSPFIVAKWPNLANKEKAPYKLLLWRAMDTKILWICNFVSFVIYARTTVMHSKSASVDTRRQRGGRWVGILLSSVSQAIMHYIVWEHFLAFYDQELQMWPDQWHRLWMLFQWGRHYPSDFKTTPHPHVPTDTLDGSVTPR
jgi:hypothetical protein